LYHGKAWGFSLQSRARQALVGVVLEAEHSCMTLRGVQAHGTRLMTSALLGQVRDEPAARAEFFDMTGVVRT
jgi:GTP cyclohydrolase I